MEEPCFFVDEISDGIATLLFAGDGVQRLFLPLSMLPHGVREGDYLLLALSVDDRRRIVAREEIDTLFEELGDNP